MSPCRAIAASLFTELLVLGVLPGCGAALDPSSTCSGEECCVALKVDRERSGAFWVDGRLYFDIFAKIAGPQPEASSYWSFDVRLVHGSEWEKTSEATNSSNFDSGVAFNATYIEPADPVSCGEVISVEVGLRSSTYDEDVQSLCRGFGFGPVTTLDLPVECPTCPDETQQSGECDFPRAGSCPTIEYNHWQGRDETLPCSCGTLVTVDEPRFWSCPIF